MNSAAYLQRRSEIQNYFDRTAVDAWRKLTSDAPVSGIRATVRAGRDRMRATLLNYLPQDLRGARILDAGCGTGAFAVEAALRGADVVAVDLSPQLVDLARTRAPQDLSAGRITFLSGDMTAETHGNFDHIVAMDSLIHYSTADIVAMLERLSERTRHSILFTIAPRTPALAVMHAVGRMFPRGDRSPALSPVAPGALHRRIGESPDLSLWEVGRHQRIKSGFYQSMAHELVRT